MITDTKKGEKMNIRNKKKHPLAKLNWEKVDNIRKRYDAGGITQKELSQEFNVSLALIGSVLRRESWVRY